MKRWLVVALVVLVMGACGKGPTEGECKQLLEHLVDLEFKKAGATATAEQQKTDMAKQKATVIENKQAEFMGVCMDKTSQERVACAIAAADLEAIAKCDSN